MKTRAVFIVIMALSACGRHDETTINPSPLSPDQMLAKIRGNGEVHNEVVFQAISDDAIVDLRDQAKQAELNGDYPKASSLLEQALAINAADPEALQSRAELAIRQQAWHDAELMAKKSFESGAKLGDLCRRNWLTMHYAKSAQGSPVPDQQLAKNLNDCTLVPPGRM